MAQKPCEDPRSCPTLRSDRPGDLWDHHDALIHYDARFDEFGLPIHDGMRMACANIAFCPWCGARLPDSKREAWFDALEALGLDPSKDDIPEAYTCDQWWRRGEGR